MTELVSRPDHSVQIVEGEDKPPSFFYQLFFDDIRQKLNDILFGESIIFPVYTVLTVPDATASKNLNGAIIVSNETGGRTIATSNGTNWLRVSDGAIVS